MSWYTCKQLVDDYYSLLCINREDHFFYFDFSTNWYQYGRKMEWKRIMVEIYPLGQPGDFLAFIGWELVLTERAWKILRPLINDAVEVLPLFCTNGEQYLLLKIIDKIDCLDYSKCVYEEEEEEEEDEDESFPRIKSYVFREELIKGKNLFRLYGDNINVVSQAFKELVEEYSLEGLKFDFLC